MIATAPSMIAITPSRLYFTLSAISVGYLAWSSYSRGTNPSGLSVSSWYRSLFRTLSSPHLTPIPSYVIIMQ